MEALMWRFRRWCWSKRLTWIIWRAGVYLRYLATGNCGCACGYAHPYGFVPEAECPIHDLS